MAMEEKERTELHRKESRAERDTPKGSMHDDIGFWCDCCSCEAEPQWEELAERLGIDLSGRENRDQEARGSANLQAVTYVKSTSAMA